jgi:hypothetical protein
VAELYRSVAPFAFELSSVESFPGVVRVGPDPSEPFLDLVERTRSAFPAYPPYGDGELDPVPHCTVGAADDAGRLDEIVREITSELSDSLPIHCRANAVTLLEGLDDPTWTTNRDFRLGEPV